MNSKAPRPSPPKIEEVGSTQPSALPKGRKLRTRQEKPQSNSHLKRENPYDDGGGAPQPQLLEDWGPVKDKVDVEKLYKEICGLDEHNQQLVGVFTRALREHGGSIDAAIAAIKEATPAAPAYLLWKDREGGRGAFNPAAWIKTHHSDLIGTEGARAAIGRRDPELIAYYVKWIQPDRHPEDDLELDTRRRTDLSCMSPAEALERKRQQVRVSMQRARERSAKSKDM